jgi:hypothetical protein
LLLVFRANKQSIQYPAINIKWINNEIYWPFCKVERLPTKQC